MGGTGHERLTRVRVASSSLVYLAGHTDSSNFPVTPGAYRTQPQGGYDAVALLFNPLNSTLLYGTRVGGSDADYGFGLAVGDQVLYLAGSTRSTNFPVTTGAFDTSYNGVEDGFALKLSLVYAVAGRITDAQGRPMAGVTVSAGGRSAQSGADGRYLLTDLAAGTYLVTPQRAGYVFTPLSRLVTLPPGVDEVNFVMAPLPAVVGLTPGVARTVTLTDTLGQTTVITFPAGAVTQTTTATVRLQPGQTGGGYYSPDMAFTVETLPALTEFAQPLAVTLRYAPGATGPLVDKQALLLWYWTGAEWIEAGATCNPALLQEHDQGARRVQAGVCRTGLYALRGPSRQIHLPLVMRNH